MTSPNPLDLTGQAVLVSGAAGAIGRVLVETLHRFGATVVANDVVPSGDAREVLPDDVAYLPADTADEAAVDELLDGCVREVGRLPDAVCCHAGVAASHPVHEFPIDEFDQLVRVNLRGSYLLARAATARWVAEQWPGQLVFTSSWVQDVPWPGIAPYSATKAALKSLTRSFARELAPNGIRANAVAPGIVAVGMAKRQWDTEPDYRARAQRAIPLGELQSPQSVADAFLYLLSPLASYVTGSTLVVDGGASLYPMD